MVRTIYEWFWKGYGRKWSWPTLRHYANICQQKPRRTTNSLSKESQPAAGTSRIRSRLPTRRCYVWCCKNHANMSSLIPYNCLRMKTVCSSETLISTYESRRTTSIASNSRVYILLHRHCKTECRPRVVLLPQQPMGSRQLNPTGSLRCVLRKTICKHCAKKTADFWSRWPGFNPGWLQVSFEVDEEALEQGFPPLIIIPPLLHTHLSPPHEVCDSPDQAEHYHTLDPKLGASSVTGTGLVSEWR
jgi:hypothetical protein